MFGFCKINFLNFFFVWSIVFFHLRLAFFGGSSTSSTSSSPTTASALKATPTKQKCPFKFMFTNNHAALSQHSLRMLHKGHLFPSQSAGTSQSTSGPSTSTSSIAEHVESQAMGSGMSSTNNALNQRFHAWRQYQYHAASTALGFASTALSDFDTVCHFSPSSFESYLPVSSHADAMAHPAKQSLKQRFFRMKSSPHHHRHAPSLSALFASSAMVDTQEAVVSSSSSSCSSSFSSSCSANMEINNNDNINNNNLMNALSANNVVLSTSTSTTKKNLTDAASLEIVALGLSHHNAKVEIREQLAIPEDQWQQVARELCALPAIQEAAILSTCNRFEMYLSGEKAYEVMREAMQFLVKRAQEKHAEKVKRAVEENGVYEGLPCLDLPTLRRSLFLLSGEDAIWHLLKVSAGLDSLVIGEGQILAQVKKAYEHATNTASSASSSSSTSSSAAVSETKMPKSETVSASVSPSSSSSSGVSHVPGGKVIARLLNAAVTAGKRVRSETGISKGAVSISSAAAEFTHWKLPTDCGKTQMAQAKIVVIGAGKMARLLLVHLSSSQHVRHVTLVVRSPQSENVRLLQAEFPELTFHFVPMEQLYETLIDADVVYPSTAAETPIINPDELRHTVTLRHERQARLLGHTETHAVSSVSSSEMETEPSVSSSAVETPATHIITGLGGLHIVDISVPRNVHPECASLPGIHAYNVDDLKQVVEKNTAKRKKEMLLAEKLLRDELWRFQTWQHALTAIPTITKLQEKAETYRQEEVNKVVHKWSQLSPKDLSLVDKLTKGIVAKLLHGPMHHLRSAAACHSATQGSAANNSNNKDQHSLEGGAVGGGGSGATQTVSSSSHLFHHAEALVNQLSGHQAIVQVQRAFQLE